MAVGNIDFKEYVSVIRPATGGDVNDEVFTTDMAIAMLAELGLMGLGIDGGAPAQSAAWLRHVGGNSLQVAGKIQLYDTATGTWVDATPALHAANQMALGVENASVSQVAALVSTVAPGVAQFINSNVAQVRTLAQSLTSDATANAKFQNAMTFGGLTLTQAENIAASVALATTAQAHTVYANNTGADGQPSFTSVPAVLDASLPLIAQATVNALAAAIGGNDVSRNNLGVEPRPVYAAAAPASPTIGMFWKNTGAAPDSGINPGVYAVWSGTQWDSLLASTIWRAVTGGIAYDNRIAVGLGVGVGPRSTVDMAGELSMRGATSGYAALKAAAVAGDISLTLPGTVGASGDTLTSDGAGNMSWQNTASVVMSFATRTAVQAANIKASVQAIRVYGYTTLGDMPDVSYKRTAYTAGSLPPHAGYIVSADGTYWVLNPANFWDIRWFGAKCDGVTDDGAAFYKCLVAADLSNLRYVRLPANNIVLNANAPYNLSGIVVEGADPNRTLLMTTSATFVMLTGTSLSGVVGMTGGGLKSCALWASSGALTYGLLLQGDRYAQPHEAVIDDVKVTGSGTWYMPICLNGQLNTPTQVLAAAVVAAGTGYQVGDRLTVNGGTPTTPAVLYVKSVNGAGAITSVTPLAVSGLTKAQSGDPGVYSALPANPVTVTGGSGAGATFNLTANTIIGLRAVTGKNWFAGQATYAGVYFGCCEWAGVSHIGTFGGTSQNIVVTGAGTSFNSAYVNLTDMDCQGQLSVNYCLTSTFLGYCGSQSFGPTATTNALFGTCGAGFVAHLPTSSTDNTIIVS